MTDWTKDKSWDRGQLVEAQRFKRLMSLIDPDIKEATREEQYQHIDWHTCIGTVDVKAMKRVSRNGSLQNELVWVEFRNTAGLNGWLFGDQKWVALEIPEGFIFVITKDLLELANKLCDTDTFVHSAKGALYKAYQRRGQGDVISMIKMDDVKTLLHFTIMDASLAPAIKTDAKDSAFI